MITKNTHKLAVVAGLALTIASANAALVSQYGILDLAANGGINPNTGVAWADGDQYRLAFRTANTFDADSADAAVHNARVNAEAQLSTLGNGNITSSTGWTAMITTTGIGVKANTNTDNATDVGFAVYAMDGMTAIARNNADIWDGWSNPFATDPTGLTGNTTLRLASGSTNQNSAGDDVVASQNVFHSPFLNQFGLGDSATVHGDNIWTGNNSTGAVTAGQEVGSVAGNTGWGSSNANNADRVYRRGNSNHLTTSLGFYAISDELTVTNAIPEPSTTALLGLGGLALILRRRK